MPASRILAGPLEPSIVIPEQFFDVLYRSTYVFGERRLMVAVLEDAVHCFQDYLITGSRRERRLHTEAEAWFSARDANWPFSFENICLTLNFDPDYLRQGLRRWKEAALSKRRGEDARKVA